MTACRWVLLICFQVSHFIRRFTLKCHSEQKCTTLNKMAQSSLFLYLFYSRSVCKLQHKILSSLSSILKHKNPKDIEQVITNDKKIRSTLVKYQGSFSRQRFVKRIPGQLSAARAPR